MKRIISSVCGIFLIGSFLLPGAFAQLKEEQEEKTKEIKKISIPSRPYKISLSTNLFFGYDSNANLSPNRKGDSFQEVIFSLKFNKPLNEQLKFTVDYDLDALNYSEFTNLSNILNHLRFGIHKEISDFTLGTGYDLGIFYYHHERDNNFLFHKGFIYLRQKISQSLYHQLQYEAGLKDYSNRKSLSDTISTYQDKERADRRQTVKYTFICVLTPRLLSRLSSEYSLNDSNARYLDFYDYKSYRQSFGLDYSLSKNIRLITNFAYRKKDYSDRTTTLGGDKQEDNLYAGSLGLIYQLNKNNALSVNYTYRENSSNESLEEYSESIITCGLRHNF